MKQTTLAKAVKYTGVGLHSGREVQMELRPAGANTGIVFVRTDVEGQPSLRAVADNVTSTVRATTIEENGVKIFTIEHLMSAFHALSIDNCQVLISSEEPPVADGSAMNFFKLLKSAGVTELAEERREVIVDKVYRVEDDGKYVIALPYDGLRVSFTSINEHELIGTQYYDVTVAPDIYEKEIAKARTIAYEKEIAMLQKMGLGLGGTIENVIVYNDDGWLNPLHYDDELVRHKILDLIGDLRLAGMCRGHFIAVKSGHALNTTMAKLLYRELVK